jgi:hypothetical protein
MNKKKKKVPTTNELAKTTRRNWNGINPVTRVVESQKNKPIKHKKREMEKESEI